jgi:hypothetical protein
MARAVEKVRARLLRAAGALEQAGVPYAVVGEQAVAAWVLRVDEAAVRNTRDVDLLLRREDLEKTSAALAAAGFLARRGMGVEMFLDGAGAPARDAVHVVFGGEKVRPEHPFPAPDVSEAEQAVDFRLISLEPLVRMKLNAFRDKDRMHLRDLIEVGLVDDSWLSRLAPEHSVRTRQLLDNPDG